MRKSMLVTVSSLFTCLLVMALGPATAFAHPSAAQSTPLPRQGGFYGTPAELVANVMPALMKHAGHPVKRADPALAGALKQAFRGSQAYLWDQTLVKTAGSTVGFSVTLPADAARLKGGEMALGVIEKGVLARAFVLRFENGRTGMLVRLTRPDGVQAGEFRLGSSPGLKADRGALTALARTLVPSEQSFTRDGTFFHTIEQLLQQVLDLLYFVRDIVNIAICAVDEVYNYFVGLEGCGWVTVHPGGGAIVDVVVCSVGETIDLVSDLFDRCF
jgi:hypothetical protein